MSDVDSIFHVDPDKVREIVTALDSDDNGIISTSEIKVLFSKLLEIDVEDIPDDHPEILAFCSLTVDQMVEELCDSISKEQFQTYYALTFPERGGGRGQAPEGRLPNPRSQLFIACFHLPKADLQCTISSPTPGGVEVSKKRHTR